MKIPKKTHWVYFASHRLLVAMSDFSWRGMIVVKFGFIARLGRCLGSFPK